MARDLRSRTLYSNAHSGKTRNRVVKDKEAKCRDAKTHQAVLQRVNDQKASDRKAEGLQSTKQNDGNQRVKTWEPGDQTIQNQEGISPKFSPSWPSQSRLNQASHSRAQSSCELTPPVLSGITGKDLPIVPSGIKDSVLKYYVGLCNASAPLTIRNLDWRENNAGEPERKPLDNTRQLQAAFAQTRGSLALTPCAPCASGKGPWKHA